MFFIWILWVGALAQVPLLTTSFKVGHPPEFRHPGDSVPWWTHPMPVGGHHDKPHNRGLKEIFNLKYPNFTFPSSVDPGDYDPKAMVAIDCFIQKLDESEHEDLSLKTHRIFITLWGANATPASLCTVTDEIGPGGNLLKPYPNPSWATCTDCDNCFLNTFRAAMDRNIAFILDSGTPRNGRTCPPKVVIMDLKRDIALKILTIPPPINGTYEGTLLVNIVIISRGPGYLNYYLAIADVSGYHMVLYKNYEFKWISSPSFRNNPNAAVITSGGLSMTLQDGILGMARNWNKNTNTLYYRAFTTYDMCVTTIRDLDEAFMTGMLKFKCDKDVLSSQTPTIAVSSEEALLYVLTNESALACMNTRNMKGGQEILEQNSETLRFASSIRVIDDILFVFTDNFVSYYDGQMDLSKINYRLQYAKTSDLLKGTKCISHGSHGGNGGMKSGISGEGDGSDENGFDESNSDNSRSDNRYDDDSNNKNSKGSEHKSDESGHGSNSKSSESSSNDSHGNDDGNNSKGNKGSGHKSDESGDGSDSKNNDGSWNKSHENGDGGKNKNSDSCSNESDGNYGGGNSENNDGSSDEGNNKNSDSSSNESHGSSDSSNSKSSKDNSEGHHHHGHKKHHG